jgi:hypothetical protein
MKCMYFLRNFSWCLVKVVPRRKKFKLSLILNDSTEVCLYSLDLRISKAVRPFHLL